MKLLKYEKEFVKLCEENGFKLKKDDDGTRILIKKKKYKGEKYLIKVSAHNKDYNAIYAIDVPSKINTYVRKRIKESTNEYKTMIEVRKGNIGDFLYLIKVEQFVKIWKKIKGKERNLTPEQLEQMKQRMAKIRQNR